MRFIVILLTFSAGLRAVCTVPSPAYFVATNGSDAWSGTLAAPNAGATDGPFRTPARAQTAMRVTGATKTTLLRTGTYAVPSAWTFSSADNGETWTEYPGETATLDGMGTGGIRMTGAVSNITFSDLTFQNFSATGFDASNTVGLMLKWNSFRNCMQNCLYGSNVQNSVVDSNTFDGQQPGNLPGTTGAAYSMLTFWWTSSGNKITHNLFTNAEGGGTNLSTGVGNPPASNNIVDRNIFRNVDTNVTDMGAIYIYDMAHNGTGNQITNNLVVGNGDAAHETRAFYLDDGASNVLVSGNICTRCGQWGWQIHAGDHNTIVNNIFDLSSAGTQLGFYQADTGSDQGMTGNVITRNLVYFGSGSVPASLYQADLLTGDTLPASTKNLYYTTNGAPIPNGAVVVDSAPVYANPLFAAPGGGNYTMPATSPAFTQVGFTALATDQGPQPECGGPVTTSGFTGIKTVTTCASISSTGNPSRCSNTKFSYVNGVLQ